MLTLECKEKRKGIKTVLGSGYQHNTWRSLKIGSVVYHVKDTETTGVVVEYEEDQGFCFAPHDFDLCKVLWDNANEPCVEYVNKLIIV